MAQITVGDVALRMRQRCDLEKSGASGFAGDAEVIKLIQLGTSQLQNLVVNAYEYWIAKYVTFTTVANQLTYKFRDIGMPDFYKLLGIGLTSNSISPQDTWTPLQHFNLQDMGLCGGGFFQFNNSQGVDMTFLLMGSAIELRPVKSAQLIGVYYVPTSPQFSDMADTLPDWVMPGWEEYMVAFGAWMLGLKERTGTSGHKEVWMLIADQIKNYAPNRDNFQVQTVTQVLGGAPYWMYGSAGLGGYYGNY